MDDKPDTEDVRVRVARRKRERMRERLLAASRSVLLGERGAAAIAEDVIGAAGVSRGTFYKYFASVDEAALAVRQSLADQAAWELDQTLSGRRRDPIDRVALSAQILMSRAVVEPGWGAFASGSEHLGQAYASAVRQATLEGRATAQFKFNSTTTAMDFQAGAVAEGIRRLAAGRPHPRAYLCEVAAMILKGLGADCDRAEAASFAASRDLAVLGPLRLPWWRDFS